MSLPVLQKRILQFICNQFEDSSIKVANIIYITKIMTIIINKFETNIYLTSQYINICASNLSHYKEKYLGSYFTSI